MSHSVLVTSVGGNIGQGVVKALRASTHSFRITGIDMNGLAAGFYFCDAQYRVPRAGDPRFMEIFLKIVKREQIRAVYVSSPSELLFFSRHREYLEKKSSLCVFVNPPEAVETGSDKFRTALFLKQNGFDHPETVAGGDAAGVKRLMSAGFPLIVKPKVGFTSHNVFKVDTKKALQGTMSLLKTGSFVVQEYIPEDEGEFTATTVSDENRKVRGCIILRRDLKEGTTYRTELFRSKRIEAAISRISEALGVTTVANLQFRLKRGRPVVFEINPRFSGTTGIRYLYGFNDPEMLFIHFCLGRKMPTPALKKAVVLRYWNEVYSAAADYGTVLKKYEKRKWKVIS